MANISTSIFLINYEYEKYASRLFELLVASCELRVASHIASCELICELQITLHLKFIFGTFARLGNIIRIHK